MENYIFILLILAGSKKGLTFNKLKEKINDALPGRSPWGNPVIDLLLKGELKQASRKKVLYLDLKKNIYKITSPGIDICKEDATVLFFKKYPCP